MSPAPDASPARQAGSPGPSASVGPIAALITSLCVAVVAIALLVGAMTAVAALLR